MKQTLLLALVLGADPRGASGLEPLAGAPAAVQDQEDVVLIRGQTTISVFPQGLGVQRRTHQIEGIFMPQDTRGRRYLAEGFVARAFDGEGGVAQTITAKRARFGLEVSGTPENPLQRIEVSERGRIQLEEVTVTRQAGHPLAPLVFSADRLDAFLAEDLLVTPQGAESPRVSVTGSGLDFSGESLRFEGAGGLLAIENGATLVLEREGGGQLRMGAPGGVPIEIARRGPPGEGLLELRSTSDEGRSLRAHTPLVTLSEPGQRPIELEATSLTLRGVAGDGEFRLVEGEAAGRAGGQAGGSPEGVDVSLRRGPEFFAAQTMLLFADEGGDLVRAILREGPGARGQGEQVRVVLGEDPEAQGTLRASGAGPLTAWLAGGAERSFLLQGPATAEVVGRDLAISADGHLEGLAAEDPTSGTLLAREGVSVRQGGSHLKTSSLDVLFFAGRESADLRSEGATRLVSTDGAGEVFTVDAELGADIRVRGQRWVVAEARGVEAGGGGEQPYRVSAGTVSDLDLGALDMQLGGGVSWGGALGEGEARSATLSGGDKAELLGEPGRPARFQFKPQPEEPTPATAIDLASVTAGTIEVEPSGLEAMGGVRLGLEGPEASWTLDADRLQLGVRGGGGGSGDPRTFSLSASGVDRAEVLRGEQPTTFRCERLLGGGIVHEGEGGQPHLEMTWAVATGRVEVTRGGAGALFAQGERLAFQGGAGRLTPEAGGHVEFHAPRQAGSPAWAFRAEALTFDGEQAWAERVTGRYEGPLLPGPVAPDVTLQPGTVQAQRLGLAPGQLVLEGQVLAQGSDPGGIPLKLETENLAIKGVPADPQGSSQGTAESLEAWGGFRAVYGGLALARGQRLAVSRKELKLLGGEEAPAVLDLGGMALNSPNLTLDLERFLVESERGRITSLQDGWSLSYAALRPEVVGGETVMVLVAPRYEHLDERARADFASVWIFAEAWAAQGREQLFGEPRSLEEGPQAPQAGPGEGGAEPGRSGIVHNVFQRMSTGKTGELVKAIHLEGSLEVTEGGRTAARASQAWIDLEGQRGWLRDAILVARMALTGGEGQSRVRVRAAEVISKGDGSLRAADATLTTSTHEVPGYVIRTGELVLLPREDGLWSFSARPNRMEFEGGFSLPLPPLGSLVLDGAGGFVGFETESGEVRTIDSLTIGDTARHGTTIGGGMRYPIGELGRRLARIVGLEEAEIDGDVATEASYLSNRGALLGVGLELRQRVAERDSEAYWFNLYVKGIEDRGEDRGLVRVDEGDRSGLRTWIHGRGRYPFNRNEWVGVQFSTQSDPGVQAEFYEREYQAYEQRETDLYWRRADGSNLYSVRAKGRMDAYRTEVEELPAVHLYGGETPIGRLGKVPLLWGRSFEAAYLRRRLGDTDYEDPFYDGFGQPDGAGEREVLRAATEQRLAAPVPTGVAGVVATPWLEAELAAWDQGADEDHSPRRASLVGGVDLATTLHRRTDAGYLHVLSPTASFKGDLALEAENGNPVRFDGLEDSPAGDELAMGVRALWSHPDRPHDLDLELRGTQRRDRDDLPATDRLALLGAYRTEAFGRPVGLYSDLRVDPREGSTVYGRGTLAIAPTEAWLFEVSHRRGRGVDGQGLFETASFDTRWTIDPKWELQVGQDINLLGSGALRSEFIVRRFGADFLFELQVVHRAGEGGTTVRVNLAPMFLWKRPPLGVLERGPRAGFSGLQR